jgi:RNA polymerase sigma factor (sigma-70 family)
LLRKYRQQSLTATPVRPDEAVSGYRLAERLHEALAELPKLQLACFVGVQFDNRSVSEVARLLGLTPEAVRMNVHRARQHLRACYV